jgi:hypothetical protein
MWFEEEVFANSMDDFFAKRPVDYTKHDKVLLRTICFNCLRGVGCWKMEVFSASEAIQLFSS